MLSTEISTNQDNVYWLRSNDMINLQMVATCVCLLSISDNSKNINQNQWNVCISSDKGYHSATNKHRFVETKYFILLR